MYYDEYFEMKVFLLVCIKKRLSCPFILGSEYCFSYVCMRALRRPNPNPCQYCIGMFLL